MWDLRGAMIKNIALTLRLLFLGHRLLIRNRTQAAVIHIFNLLFFINLTFRMLYSTYVFKSTVTILSYRLIWF